MARVRAYDVLLRETFGSYLSVHTTDDSLIGDLWLHTAVFRWNGDEFDRACGRSEMLGLTSLCVWGQGIASAASDGTLSGVLDGGVDFGEQHCLNQSHRFVLRPKKPE